MRLLIDTHTLLWSFNASPELTLRARRALENQANEILVSAASAWEIATKVRLGKLPTGRELVDDFEHYLKQVGFETLSISFQHAVRAGRLHGEYRDPFDRMLISQALSEDLPIVSNDRVFDAYGVQRIW